MLMGFASPFSSTETEDSESAFHQKNKRDEQVKGNGYKVTAYALYPFPIICNNFLQMLEDKFRVDLAKQIDMRHNNYINCYQNDLWNTKEKK